MVTASHYILDTNVVIQSPEVLASARGLKLLVPKSVLGELTARGSWYVRNVVGALINDALNAGVEIVEAPTQLKNELIASDRHAQRLGGADFDIARIAIGLTERSVPVCVVTLDRALRTFLESRSIRSITPNEFLKERDTQSIDPTLLSSARSVSSGQKRYLLLSAILSAVVSFGANVIYSHATILLSTISVWGTVVALPLVGVGLYWYRQRYRLSYGIFELLVGITMSIYVFFPKFDYEALGVALGLQVLAGLYVMVRGLDNVGTGLQGTKLEVIWNRAFGRI